ncbi:MAG: hypothetical protein AAEC03_09400 [Synechococcus sp.]
MTTSSFDRASARARFAFSPSIVAGVVLIAALVLAPDDPSSQASICERHHSSDVCRVW